jgi:hypothetical protein
MIKIKPVSYDSLKVALLDFYYFPRKRDNQICCVIDIETKLIYPVPVIIEHIDFISLLTKKDIKTNPLYASKIIPSNILIDKLEGIVYGLITGVSGAESGYGVRHSAGDINEAHELIRGFVKKGEPEFKLDLINDEKVHRYCKS